MEFIIFDLEWNSVFQNGKLYNQDITEIGAVEVSEVDQRLILGRKFHSYVRPQKTISPQIRQLTNLQEADRWLAHKFPIVLKHFYKWLGHKSYIFCSWGEQDRTVLQKNLRFYQLKGNYFTQYFDLQKAFSVLKNHQNGNRIGLLKAIETLGLTFEGTPHCSVDDAFNTAKVFMKTFHQLSIHPEPFLKNWQDHEYKKQILNIIKLRKELDFSYQELSIISNISQEELKQMETFQVQKKQKEITRLVNLLYAMKAKGL